MAKKIIGEREKQLAELVVTPRGNYTEYTGEESDIPTIKEYMDAEAREARINAINHIIHQYAPNVPIIPRQKYGSTRAIDSQLAGILGMSDKDRMDWFGVEPNPETCIYTATSQFGDNGALVSGNKTFWNNPKKYGFVGVPMNESEEGDLIQFSNADGPHHSALQTGWNYKGVPTLSYSNGNTTPYVVEDGETVYTMVKDRELDNKDIQDHKGYPYPVFSQTKLKPLGSMSTAEFNQTYLPILQKSLLPFGYTGDGITSEFTNGTRTLVDIKPDNMGLTSDGRLRFFDVDYVDR